MNRHPLVAVVSILLITASLAIAEPVPGAISTDHPLATEAGGRVLDRGGNAVDAAVASSLMLSVVRPYSCGVGGGGFMIVWIAEENRAVAVDYRERAPLAANADLFTDSDNPRIDSRTGGAAVAVPGTVFGLHAVHSRYGTLAWRDVLDVVIELADRPFPIDDHTRKAQQRTIKKIRGLPNGPERFGTLWRMYLNNGEPWPEGAMFRSPQVPLLRKLRDHGPEIFREGPVAASMVRTVRNHAGVLTADDLKSIKPVFRNPLVGEFDGYRIVTMPPPSSGGIALLEMLNVITAYERQSGKPFPNLKVTDPQAIHLTAEVMQQAFADRGTHLGDADFVTVPIERLISRRYAEKQARKLSRRIPRTARQVGGNAVPDDAGTSHLSIIDREGNAVACTETINTYYGSLVVDPEYGIVLNNEMDDFTARPGKPNVFGLIQSSANAIEPGKKPLSSMTPTLVLKDDRVRLAVGASGGPRIITATFSVLYRVLREDLSPAEAVAAPRFHHQWLPEQLFVEPGIPNATRRALIDRGYVLKPSSELGVSQAVGWTGNRFRAAADPRKGGSVRVLNPMTTSVP